MTTLLVVLSNEDNRRDDLPTLMQLDCEKATGIIQTIVTHFAKIMGEEKDEDWIRR